MQNSGGIGAELTGGNFFQGFVIGGIVAGLNHAMHAREDGPGPKKKDAYIQQLKGKIARMSSLKLNHKRFSTDCLNAKDANLYSNTMTVKSVAGFFQNSGDGMALTGYGLTLTGIGAEVGIPLAGAGNVVSGIGTGFTFFDSLIIGDYSKMSSIIGFQAINYGTGHLSSKIQGFSSLGKEIFKQNLGLKIWLIEKYYSQTK